MPHANIEDRRAYHRAATARYRARNPERYKAQGRDCQRRKVERLAGRPRPEHCECCGAKGGDYKPDILVRDHDHATEEFRGWICSSCNLALGMIKDDPQRALQLASYLSKK